MIHNHEVGGSSPPRATKAIQSGGLFNMVAKPLLPLMVLALHACTAGFDPADETAIRAVMAEQERAWDRGDIEGFMAGYSDTICFLSPKGRTCGRQAVTANYRATYPDARAMGDLTFGIHEVLSAGPDHAWVTGSWSLAREEGKRSGGFALFWRRGDEGWRIVRDLSH